MEKDIMTTLEFKTVSVPYRGATFLNQIHRSKRNSWRVSVPYRGATFLNKSPPVVTVNICQFPSPIGELHFSMGEPQTGKSTFLVSVPYRGATFLNRKCQLFPVSCTIVSVPYRGATFLNTIPATPCSVWDRQGDCGGKVILLKCSRFGK